MDDAVRDHSGMEVLSLEQCEELLADGYIGRLGFVDKGDPVILPVNYAYRDGAVLVLTAQGSKLDAAAVRAPVAFEIDGWDVDYHNGWSVLVTGILEELDGDEERKYEDIPLTPWAKRVDRTHWLRVRADKITGRRIS